jgi:multidrug transporter EmrE-like cation transporter
MIGVVDLLLFGIYAIGSVTSLLLIKHWLPLAQATFRTVELFAVPNLLVCGGAILYVVSFLIWMVILTRNDLTVAYPIAVGLTLLLSTIGATMLLNEPVSAMRVAGVVLIFAGIVTVVRS